MATQKRRRRSTLPKNEARQRYVEIGELVVLEQIKKDSEALDERSIAVGPFARLDAGAVAAREGKTRRAINNLFGNQAAFQAQTMAPALPAGAETILGSAFGLTHFHEREGDPRQQLPQGRFAYSESQ